METVHRKEYAVLQPVYWTDAEARTSEGSVEIVTVVLWDWDRRQGKAMLGGHQADVSMTDYSECDLVIGLNHSHHSMERQVPMLIVEAGKYYQDRNGRIVKVLVQEVLSMRPLTSQFQADLEARKLHSSYDDLVEKAPVRCFRCWSGGDDGDFYVIPDGRACQPYKLLSGEEPRWAYPLPESPNQAEDLVREVDPGAVDQRRFGEKTFEVTHYVALHLRIRARNIDFTYDELPPEPVVVEALRPLFASSAVEVSSIEYEYGEVESDEDEVEE